MSNLFNKNNIIKGLLSAATASDTKIDDKTDDTYVRVMNEIRDVAVEIDTKYEESEKDDFLYWMAKEGCTLGIAAIAAWYDITPKTHLDTHQLSVLTPMWYISRHISKEKVMTHYELGVEIGKLETALRLANFDSANWKNVPAYIHTIIYYLKSEAQIERFGKVVIDQM